MCVTYEVNEDVVEQDHPCNVNGLHIVIFLLVMILHHFPNLSLQIYQWTQQHENAQKCHCVTSEHKT